MTILSKSGVSTVTPNQHATWLQRLSFVTAAVLFSLIVLGSVARAVGAAVACGSVLLCSANLPPITSLFALVDYGYLLLALCAALLVAATGLLAWRKGTPGALVATAVRMAVLLLLGLVALNLAGLWLGFNALLVTTAFGMALALLACLIVVGATPATFEQQTAVSAGQHRYRRSLLLGGGALFALILLGNYSASVGSNPLLPQGVQGLHRYAAIGVGLLLAVLLYRTIGTRWQNRAVRQATLTLGLGYAGMALVGAASLLLRWPPLAASLHLAFASAAWVGAVGLALAAWNVPAQRVGDPVVQRPHWRQVLDDYIKLTKPGVISLLLLTTLTTMYVAGQPSLALVCWTLLGGYLMAGGANAINCYIDRDVDVLMGRTARRPIPSNRINPNHALFFGLTLGALAFAVFALFVNLLSAALGMFALLFYVVIYTSWLKRSSTQNIVIGGAAGAIPPLIGWTAVTNQLSLLPLLLFVIIFYWTPPHFWALALIRREDYARASIPMLPVVVGERETKWQIVLYSIIMVVMTLLPVPFRLLGPIYLLCALALAAVHMMYALRLMRESGTGSAWKLYRFSLLYLALLFAAMVLDVQVMRVL